MIPKLVPVLCLAVGVAAAPVSAAGNPPAAPPGLTVSQAVRHDVSPPLGSIHVAAPVPGPNRTVPNAVRVNPALHGEPVRSGPDPLLQSGFTAAGATPQPSASFEGLSDDDNAAVVGFRIVPPDTEGDVGLTRYVQWNNVIFAVYDKATGNRTFGPVPGNSIWSGFGGICESNNDGDPIVLYDHLADRWLLSQFAIGSEGHQCVAVSTTNDPTGSYARYDFLVSPGTNGFNDYPKLGVWPDAYYMSANQFHANFDGALAVAFDRSAMLAGQSASMVSFLVACGSECFFAIQPAHLEGPAPAAGTPETYVMAFDDETWGTGSGPDGYRLWQFHVDFANPGNSTFTPLGQVDTAEFDANLCNFNTCITQPSPGERLDALGQFTMYRAQYRHFADHDGIVINHTVDVDGRDTAGIRWAELRNTGSGWFLQQSGTFSPDGDNRWLGSIAMDGAGDIALGYTVSSRRTLPSIRYATRTAADPLGQLAGGEVEAVAGGGVQRSSSGRWGDYSTLSVDPGDDCTFWLTNEYYANNGSFDFKTRIAKFALPECTGGGGCTVTENPEVSCNDGLDNDCDGLIDAADPDCQGGGGCTLGQKGDACSVDADCCSNHCGGKPGAKTCK